MDGNQQEALDLAAEETYLRIDEDRAGLRRPLRTILTTIRRRLFDAGYRPPLLGGKGSAARAFYHHFGEAPESYVRGARLETSIAQAALEGSAEALGEDLPGLRLIAHTRLAKARLAVAPGISDSP